VREAEHAYLFFLTLKANEWMNTGDRHLAT